MRRGYLDFTADFAQTVGLDMVPRAWRLVGSKASPVPNVVRLVFENDYLPDGPEAHLQIEVTETYHERRVVVLIDGKAETGPENSREEMSPVLNGTLDCTGEPVAPAPVRYYLSSDNSGHRYAIPVERAGEWTALIELSEDNPAGWDVPAWAIRIEGGFTFAGPSR